MVFHYHEKIECSDSEYDTYNLAKINLEGERLDVYCREEVSPEIEELTHSWAQEFKDRLPVSLSNLCVEVYPLTR